MILGILGDGQLAQMLGEAARRLQISHLCLRTESITGLNLIKDFVTKITHLTFENEFIDTRLIQAAIDDTKRSVKIYPELKTIEVLQNKIGQKKLLNKLGILNSPIQQDFSHMTQAELARSVFKWATFGYDGKGTLIAPKSQAELNLFLNEAKSKGTETYAEKKISFLKELAIVGCRKLNGEFASYPLVISVQKNGICDTVYGPATDFGIEKSLDTKAREIVRKIADELQYVGVLGVEFFLTENNELFVNEIAPRVHNSAHYSLLFKCSQFENHVRAVADLNLGHAEPDQLFAMKNLIGVDPKKTRFVNETGFYDYKKIEVRKGRKMGHVNFKGNGLNFKIFCEKLPAIQTDREG